jgi:hypothetical protein
LTDYSEPSAARNAHRNARFSGRRYDRAALGIVGISPDELKRLRREKISQIGRLE